MYQIWANGFKIALVFEEKEANQIMLEHNSHDQLVLACKCALWSLEATGRDVCTDGTETKPARMLRDALKSAHEERKVVEYGKHA